MAGQTGWTEEKVVERAEFVGRTVKELCQLLRAGGEYKEVLEQIARARGALESIRIAVWQRELTRTLKPGRRGAA
jgi:DNA-binding FrmR family transcriptional regulator